VFGFSFGELVVLMIVAVVVIGPKDMPKVLRKMGQYAGKLRRMASDIRAQSGIDDVLRGEGIADDIAEIRKLARGEMENVTRAATINAATLAGRNDPYVAPAQAPRDDIQIHRDREYPREGADSYRALADTAMIYAQTLPPSPLARDPLYMGGAADAVLPPEEKAAAAPAPATTDAAAAEVPAETSPAQPSHEA
jgi:sec-independent protein translocase protein TatB